MKPCLKIKVAALFATYCLFAYGQSETSTETALKEKLDKYVAAMSFSPVNVQCEECDFIIEACKDSLVRQMTACHIHSLLMESKVMGQECVAVHVFDKWFSDGTVRFKDDASFFAAKLHASLNRPTLLGRKAPSLSLKDSSFNDFTFDSGKGRVSLLLFYDAGCPKCRLESLLITGMLNEEDWPVDFFAIYAGNDEEEWKEFREQNLKMSAGNTRLFNLWDPDDCSGMAGIYGLIQTPKILICDEDGTIIGRNLDAKAVKAILDEHFTYPCLNYGSEESMTFFEGLLPSGDEREIRYAADYLAENSLEKGGRDMFRQMMGDLLYYLSSKPRAVYVRTCDYVIDRYIYGNRAWANQDDSLKITGLADMLKGLHSRTPVGEKLPDVELWGGFVKADGTVSKARRQRPGKPGKDSLALLFYTQGCPDCSGMLQKAGAWVGKGRKVLAIKMEEAEERMPEEKFILMMDSFDLSSFPHLMTVSPDRTVTGNYLEGL